MNLAQCIDPEWVQRYFAESSRKRVAKPAPKVERRVPDLPDQPKVAVKPPPIAESIREALRDTTGKGNALTLALIREGMPEVTSLQVSTGVGTLRRIGHVERAGAPGEYRYWLTALGRENLEG